MIGLIGDSWIKCCFIRVLVTNGGVGLVVVFLLLCSLL